jgi:8-oxo-dGTP pyrophosphatase MutT (NUDIX family)
VAEGGATEHPDVPPGDAETQHVVDALWRDAVTVLTGWRAPSPEQDLLRRQYLEHLARHSDGLRREGPPAHLTASCFVLDEPAEHVLLCLHGKGRFWVQFGGHLEPDDPTLMAGALREAREESGLDHLTVLGDQPVDLDRHALSSAFGRCREHLDVAFAAAADRSAATAVSAESDDVAWWPVHALPPDVVPDLPRRLHALVSRLTC